MTNYGPRLTHTCALLNAKTAMNTSEAAVFFHAMLHAVKKFFTDGLLNKSDVIWEGIAQLFDLFCSCPAFIFTFTQHLTFEVQSESTFLLLGNKTNQPASHKHAFLKTL